MPDALSPIFMSLVAAGSLVFGSSLPSVAPLRTRLTAHRLAMLIGLSAGLMLALALHDLLPEAIEQSRGNPALALAGAGFGFLVLYVVERLTHFHACRHRECETHNDDHVHGRVHTHAHTTMLGVGLHNFIDGLITAVAFAVDPLAGVLVVAAIVLHQVAVGFSLGALLLRAGQSRGQIRTSTAVTGSFILWGVLAHQFLPVTETVQGFLLGVAGGSFLYIGACDLLPEAHNKDEGVFVMVAMLLGYALALGMIFAFGEA